MLIAGCGLFGSDRVSDYNAAVIESIAGANVEVTGLNASGWVTGVTTTAVGRTAFLWTPAERLDLGACSPADINDAGQIACNTPDGPALWADGTLTRLAGTDTMTGVRVTSINDSGHVAGGKLAYLFRWRGPNTVEFHAQGGFAQIGRMNNLGAIAFTAAPGLYPKPFVFKAGTSAPSAYTTCGRAGSLIAVNDNEHGIGTCEAFVPLGMRPAFWAAADQVDTLNAGDARDLNSADDIVGDSESRAVRWRNLARTFLDDVTDLPAGLSLIRAHRINDVGQIAAVGRWTDGKQVLVVLTPR